MKPLGLSSEVAHDMTLLDADFGRDYKQYVRGMYVANQDESGHALRLTHPHVECEHERMSRNQRGFRGKSHCAVF